MGAQRRPERICPANAKPKTPRKADDIGLAAARGIGGPRGRGRVDEDLVRSAPPVELGGGQSLRRICLGRARGNLLGKKLGRRLYYKRPAPYRFNRGTC